MADYLNRKEALAEAAMMTESQRAMRCQRCGGPYHHEDVTADRDELLALLRRVVEAQDAIYAADARAAAMGHKSGRSSALIVQHIQAFDAARAAVEKRLGP